MGLFRWSKAGSEPPIPTEPQAPSQVLPKLSIARVKTALEANSYAYGVDTDGDLSGDWPHGRYYFMTTGKAGELFHVRGVWRRELAEEDFTRVIQICNAWNADKYWPKAYASLQDDFSVCALGEVTVDYTPGVCDEQLQQHLLCSIATCEALFEHLSESFPQLSHSASD